MDIADLQSEAERRGFTHNFAFDGERLRCTESGECYGPSEARIVDSRSVDTGTDPADDATIYLIETSSGRKGYLILADAFHADPSKSAFIDRLARDSQGQA